MMGIIVAGKVDLEVDEEEVGVELEEKGAETVVEREDLAEVRRLEREIRVEE